MKTTKTKHTPEPWTVLKGYSVGTYLVPGTARESVANCKRIVACVNACAGMADPQKEIADLKRQADLWLNHVASHDNLP